MKLLLIRHAKMAGDPYATPPSPVTGCLAKEGIAQAEALAAELADIPIDTALASPYGRAVETAECALAGRGIPIVRVPGLEEWMPSDAFRNAVSTEAEAMLTRDCDRFAEETWKTDLGEGAYDLLARTVPALLDALAQEGWHNRLGGWVPDTGTESKTIAVFAHGGSLNAMLSFLLGVRPFPVGSFSFSYCGMAMVDFTERRGIYYPCLRIA
jgi:broad specificity phosphatase PhoE